MLQTSRRRVLIVDSDPSFGHALEQDFRTRAFDVEMVATPEEAIQRVAIASPDLVVLDLYLRDAAAPKLIRLWKTAAPTLVVILVSGNASLSVVVEALKEGARGFFTKPVSASALLDELEQRTNATRPYWSPLWVADGGHQLGTAALNADGVDRFFAISPGLLCVAGFDGYLKMLNPAWEKTLGYSVDELCQRPYLELVHPEDREKATDEALEIRGGQTVFHFKNRYRCKDGSYRWLAWSATPAPSHQLIYASARDVTKTVRMEQGLRATNDQLNRAVATGALMLRESAVKNDALIDLGRFKDEVAAMISHDLKNPLAVIIANYDFILEGFDGSTDCLEALQDSQSAARRMLRLLENLADVARLEEGTLRLRISDVTLSGVLQGIVDQRRVLARRRQIALSLVMPAEIVVAVDADLLTRTVENVLDNALRYTPDGGVIEIAASEGDVQVEIRVGNSGISIPANMRDAIFEKHRQAGYDIGRMNLGLGLYFCRLAMASHAGRIWVEETERFPATFVICLPRLVQPTAMATPPLLGMIA